jgi:hypothetical protein
MLKGLLVALAVTFSLSGYALTDDDYMVFTEALNTGNTKVVKKFVDAEPALVNQKFFAWEPLQMTASKGHLETSKYLVEKGADKDYVHPASQNTAFHMAAFSGNKELLKFLASSGADVNKKLKGDVSLVRYFKDQGQQEMAQFLESLGVKNDGCQEEKCF